MNTSEFDDEKQGSDLEEVSSTALSNVQGGTNGFSAAVANRRASRSDGAGNGGIIPDSVGLN